MGFIYLMQALVDIISFQSLLYMTIAVQLGIIVGMLPGLTATVGIALLTGLTFKWDTGYAVITLIGMYIGAIYGGSRTAILLNIPGTPAAAATCLDGYPLSRRGDGARAIGLATTASFLGSMIGMIALAFLTPLLGDMALKFKSYELFWIAIFGVVICGNLTSEGDALKGWISGMAGIMFSFVGLDAIQGFPRLTFGYHELDAGFSMIAVMVGGFGLVEILDIFGNHNIKRSIKKIHAIGRVLPSLKDIMTNRVNIIRSGLIGVFTGIIPGVGEIIGSYVAYDFAKRSSKTPEEFGKGSIEGLIAAETANNACVGGALIPVLSLAIPGSPPAAVLLAALWLHNVRPGPLLFIENPMYPYKFTAMFLLATFIMFILGILIVKPLLRILKVKDSLLMPVIFLLCIVGTYTINIRTFDLWVMLLFAIFCLIMKKNRFPISPFILGIILGPMVDENLRRGLILSDGDFSSFFSSGISIVLVILTLIALLGKTAPVTWMVNKIKKSIGLISGRKTYEEV